MENVNNKIAYAEIYEFLEYLGDSYKKRIPEKYYQNIIEQKPENYNVEEIQENVANAKFSNEALEMILHIKLNYFIEDELARKIYKKSIGLEDSETESIDIPQINPETIKMDIFTDRKIKKETKEEVTENANDNKEMVEYEKMSLFSKIINKLKKWLKK